MWICSITELQGETHSFFLQQTRKSSHSVLVSYRTHNTLYAPEMLAKMSEPFTKALDMLEAEKSAILGRKSNLFFLEVYLTSSGLQQLPHARVIVPSSSPSSPSAARFSAEFLQGL